jgi:hypothetical protein
MKLDKNLLIVIALVMAILLYFTFLYLLTGLDSGDTFEEKVEPFSSEEIKFTSQSGFGQVVEVKVIVRNSIGVDITLSKIESSMLDLTEIDSATNVTAWSYDIPLDTGEYVITIDNWNSNQAANVKISITRA